jgi:hypothetical protein
LSFRSEAEESASVLAFAFACFFVCHSEAECAESAFVVVFAFVCFFVCHSEAKRAESASVVVFAFVCFFCLFLQLLVSSFVKATASAVA